MGFTDKVMRKREDERLMKALKRTDEFKRLEKQWKLEDMDSAIAWFCVIGADYLYRNYGCKKNGITKFLDFANFQIKQSGYEKDYYFDLNMELKKETGMDVFQYIKKAFRIREESV